MSPRGLFGRSRAVRVAFYLALVPVYVGLAFVAIDALGGYSEIGDGLGVAAIVAFAAWAWWYSERRDRRAAEVDRADGDLG